MKRLVICFFMALWAICLSAEIFDPYNVVLIPNAKSSEYSIVVEELQSCFESMGFYVYVGEDWSDITDEEWSSTIRVKWEVNPGYGRPSLVTVKISNVFDKIVTTYIGSGNSFTIKGDLRGAMREIVKEIKKTPYDFNDSIDIDRTTFPPIKMSEKEIKNYISTHKTEDIEGIYKLCIREKFKKIAVIRQDDRFCVFYLEDLFPFEQGDIIAYLELVANGLYIATYRMLDNSIHEGLAQYKDLSLRIGLTTNKAGKDVMDLLAIKLKINGINTQKNPSSTDNGTMVASGSGFFVSDRIIATNYHVVENANSIKIRVKGKSEINSYHAKVLITDKTNDLALVSITDREFVGVQAIPYKFYLDTKDVGTSIFTMGYPLSQILGTEIKITDGIISSKTGYEGDIVTYQITAPIQPGNSGGALFDKNGVLVGITNAGITNVENVGYAIKTIYLKNLIESSPVYIELPQGQDLKGKDLTELVKILSPYVVFVEIY